MYLANGGSGTFYASIDNLEKVSFFHRVQFLMKKDTAAAKKHIYLQKLLLNVPKGPV